MRISDWSSDVCSSDLNIFHRNVAGDHPNAQLFADHEHQGIAAFGPCLQVLGMPGKIKLLTLYIMLIDRCRSEERRVGKECSVRVDLGGRRIIKKKIKIEKKKY